MATIPKKLKLLRGLLSGEIAYTGPFFVMVDLTQRCNLQCLGCHYHSPLIKTSSSGDPAIQDIPIPLFQKLCEELSELTTNEIILTGEGEPFLHPHLFDIISTAKAAELQVTLLTNGTLLDESHIRSLIDSRPDILIVSLWANSPEEYELNYPGETPDQLKKVIDGLKLLSTFKAKQNSKLPSVVLHQPINRFNYQNIEARVDLAYETGCNALSFSPFYTHRGKLTPYELSSDELQSLYHSLTQMRKRLNAFSINHNVEETFLRYQIGEAVLDKFPCYTPWFHSWIKMDGTVFPCHRCNLPLGNLKINNFREIWNGLSYRTFRRKMVTFREQSSNSKDCDCSFCCFVGHNRRIHQLFKWVSPFLLKMKRPSN